MIDRLTNNTVFYAFCLPGKWLKIFVEREKFVLKVKNVAFNFITKNGLGSFPSK
jgi:hypothetical protein